jgi:hypothetical protein
MREVKRASGGACWWMLVLVVGACVDTKPDDPMGAVSFRSGFASLDSDYEGGAGGASGSTPMTTAATGAAAPITPMGGNGGAGMGVTPVSGAGGAMAVGGMGGTGVMMVSGTGGAALGGMGGSKAGSGGMGGGGIGGSAGKAGSAGTAEAGSTSTGESSAGMLSIHFTTVNQGGRYAPANVGAVWIETDSGMFIKTIKRWGNIRYTHLTAWAAASGGWPTFFGGGNAADQMDALSSATERTHGTRDLTWDMKDPMGKLVPDGKYKVRIEVTEDNFVPGANASATFTKGPMPDMETPPDQEPWSGLTLNYKP